MTLPSEARPFGPIKSDPQIDEVWELSTDQSQYGKPRVGSFVILCSSNSNLKLAQNPQIGAFRVHAALKKKASI